ncbi:hypothetical protein C8J57DRAFT_1030288, partial [Mycena rebaudengoi]
YEPGFVEHGLTFGHGGVSLYGQYEKVADKVILWPHAVAFIAEGGVVSYVAQLLSKPKNNLLRRYLHGPSSQVSYFGKGDFLMDPLGTSQRYTRDMVSEGQISQLLSEIHTGHPSTNLSLWPSQILLEELSTHFSGIMTASRTAILDNLANDIKVKKYNWRTCLMWASYFRSGNKGHFGPTVNPTLEDFERGEQLMQKAYPISWQHTNLRNIVVLE